MDKVFPTLKEIPVGLSTHFQQMIDWLEYANSQGTLPAFKNLAHMFQILDAQGVVRCLFKSCQGDEMKSMIEASVYLLDHPIDGPRSSSPTIYGFAGVLPTIFVRFKNINGEMESGVLMEFKEVVNHIEDIYDEDMKDEDMLGINMDQVHKISLVDVRFGNMDRNGQNILVTIEENRQHFVPIDHEMCFVNEGQDYNLCGPYWLSFKDGGLNEALSQECVDYVSNLDVDADIAFLRRCGWNFPKEYIERFKIFTTFLKKAVAQGFTPFHIGKIASYKCNDQRFNLQEMVRSVEEEFVARVGNRIDERLTEYDE